MPVKSCRRASVRGVPGAAAVRAFLPSAATFADINNYTCDTPRPLTKVEFVGGAINGGYRQYQFDAAGWPSPSLEGTQFRCDEGGRKIYAAALMAFALGKSVSVAFDDATTYCYLNRLTMNK